MTVRFLKEFFKPNKAKILSVLILLAIVFILDNVLYTILIEFNPNTAGFISFLLFILTFPALSLSGIDNILGIFLIIIVLIPYLYLFTCSLLYIFGIKQIRSVNSSRKATISKSVSVLIFLSFSVALFYNSYLDYSSKISPLNYCYTGCDTRIKQMVSRMRIAMINIRERDGNYDNFSCERIMLPFCQEIMHYYKLNDNRKIKIILDSQKNAKVACLFTPLNENKDYWYCIDSQGNSGATNINPDTPNYCVEGKSAVCPPVFE